MLKKLYTFDLGKCVHGLQQLTGYKTFDNRLFFIYIIIASCFLVVENVRKPFWSHTQLVVCFVFF